MTLFGKIATSTNMIFRNGMRKGFLLNRNIALQQQKRQMGGGGGYLQTSPIHQQWGEAFGVVCWLWIFYRARKDLPVVLGWRHPWEHGDEDH